MYAITKLLRAAEGTFELLVRDAAAPGRRFFEVDGYEVTMQSAGKGTTATATVRVHAGGEARSATETGHGPVNALHLCRRKCLSPLYLV